MVPERVSDLSQLLSGARAARGGAGTAVLVDHTAGMKCDELLADFLNRQRTATAPVLTALCRRADADTPYAAARQLAAGRPAAQSADRDGPRLLDELQEHLLAPSAATARTVLAADIQWMDLPTLHWLAALTRRIAGAPLLLVLARRTDQPAPRTLPLVDEIAAQPLCRTLVLRPLSRQSVRQTVEAAYPEQPCADAFTTACADATGGNPAALDALLNTLRTAGVPPDGDRADQARLLGLRLEARAVAARLRDEPAPLRDTAEAAAVLARDDDSGAIDAALTAELLDTSVEHVEAQLAALAGLGAGRLPAATGRTAFRTTEICAEIHRGIPDERRRALHMAAARRFSDYGAPPARVADHLLRADVSRDAWARSVLREAARESLDAGRPGQAAAYARRVLRHSLAGGERAEALLVLGRAEALFAPDAACRHLTQTARLSAGTARAARAGLELAYARALRDGCEPGTAAAAEPADPGPVPPELRLRLRSMGPPAGRAGDGEPEPGARELASSPAGRELLAALALDLACRGEDRATALDHVEQALAGAPAVPAGNSAVVLGLRCAAVLTWAGRAPAAERWIARMLERARELDAHHWRLTAHCLGADAALAAGDLPAARQHARAAAALAATPELQPVAVLARTRLAGVLAASGRPEQAAAELRDVPAPAPRVLGVRGACRLAAGDARGALVDLLECGRRLTELGVANPAVSGWRGRAALAGARLDDPDTARRLAAEELGLALRWGEPAALGRALRICGTVAVGARGAALLDESAEVLEGSGNRLQLALTLVESGWARARRGRCAEARPQLRRAMELAQEAGADRLVQQARAALHASGGRLRGARLLGPAALTVTERQVADLAVAGHTNRAITARLSVTPGTVEAHLTHVYRKLRITGRTGLGAALRQPAT